MITLPADLVQTRYPGYFWSSAYQQVYSIKSGTLTPLSRRPPFMKRGVNFPGGYIVSVNGRRAWLTWSYLRSLKNPSEENHELPIQRAFRS